MARDSTAPGSAEGKGPEAEIWTDRLNSAVRRFESFLRNQLSLKEVLGPYGEYFKLLVEQIFYTIQNSRYIDDLIKAPHPEDQGWIVEISGATIKLESLLNQVSALTVQMTQIPQELFGFVDNLYSRFSRTPAPYLLAIPFVRGAPFTQDYMEEAIKPNIEAFPEARRYVEGKKLYVIYVSPEIVEVPANWALLIHETAHIVEGQELKVVESFYPQIVLRAQRLEKRIGQSKLPVMQLRRIHADPYSVIDS